MLTDELGERNDGKENLNVNKMVKFSEFNSSQVINEARLLLNCGSPMEENTLIMSPNDSPMKTLNCEGSVSNRHIDKPLPAIKKTQARKSVRFNMEKNVTFDVQPDIYSPDSDSDSTVENNGNFRVSANDLGISDDDDDDNSDDDDNDNKSSMHKAILGITNDKRHIMGEIDEMEKQKSKLAKDLENLRNKHEKEMTQLRQEYKQRREDYYDELDEVQEEMNQKRNAYNAEFSEFQDVIELKKRQEVYNEENRKIEEKEEELKQKKEHVFEQEKELKEYEAYLERRHKSLNKKEEDLCMLQDELEELSDVLKEEEKRKKLRQERLTTPIKECNHDEAEIEKTRILLNNSLRVENEMQQKLKKKDEEMDDKNNTITQLMEEKGKLETKIKHLESQLLLNINRPPSSPSHFVKQTNFKLITSSIPVDEKTGECRLPQSRPSIAGGLTDVLSPKRHVPTTLVPSDTNRSRMRLDCFSKVSYNREANETISDDDAITPIDEIQEIIEMDDMYAADTTSPRTTDNKTAFSKTCALM